ncbi:hypothetical protein UlMin_017592 [Ulmus minor]
MRPQCFLVILALLLPLAAYAGGRLGGQTLAGGWKPIENLKDPEVKEIADYAVAEYNKRAKLNLKLKSVVQGETQVVAGLNYRLVLEVQNGKKPERYQAVVWEKTWEHFRNLTSFTHV